MATLAQIQAEIIRKVQDDSYTPDIITGMINDLREKLAEVYCLSLLKAEATLTTIPGEGKIPLPDNFQPGTSMAQSGRPSLFHAFNTTTGKRLTVYRSIDQLLADKSRVFGKNGALEFVTTEETEPQGAQGTLTVGETLPVADDQFTVGSQVFTFAADRDDTTGLVTLGATAGECATNIATAIDTDLSAVTAEASGSVVTVTSDKTGMAGNNIVLTSELETLVANGSGTLGGTTLGVEGAWLYLVMTPSTAQTIRTHYFRYPTALSAATDVPRELPKGLHKPLLVNGVCQEIFLEIYEGDEAAAPVNIYEDKYATAIEDLEKIIGPYPREPEQPRDVLEWGNL